VLRYNGIDKERVNSAVDDMDEAIERVKDFDGYGQSSATPQEAERDSGAAPDLRAAVSAALIDFPYSHATDAELREWAGEGSNAASRLLAVRTALSRSTPAAELTMTEARLSELLREAFEEGVVIASMQQPTEGNAS
jgi:hypothetical protein